jgi:hypothetical protein
LTEALAGVPCKCRDGPRLYSDSDNDFLTNWLSAETQLRASIAGFKGCRGCSCFVLKGSHASSDLKRKQLCLLDDRNACIHIDA